VLAVGVLILAGCAHGAVGGTTGVRGDSGSTAIRVRYEVAQEGGEADGVLQVLDVIARGEQFRMSLSDATRPDEVYQTVVWDGGAMLLLEGEDSSRQENPSDEERPTSFIVREGDAAFERRCPGGTRKGSVRVADRAGTVYACPAHGTGEMLTESSEITLDDATGLLLRTVSATGHMEAVEVHTDAAIEDDTFSTEIPPGLRGTGADEPVDSSGKPLPLTSTESVPLAGGGELLLADIRHGPSLVVVGEQEGVRAMLAHVLPRTDRGTTPPVYVLLNPIAFDEADNGDLPLSTQEGTRKLVDEVSAQVLDIPVPVGIDIKGGAAAEQLRPFDDIMGGGTVLAAIDESGALAWRLTDAELAENQDQLDDWIDATT
jgi:hypothetical protein